MHMSIVTFVTSQCEQEKTMWNGICFMKIVDKTFAQSEKRLCKPHYINFL